VARDTHSQEIEEQLEAFTSYLRDNGLNMTRQRELLVRTFLDADGHLSAEELFELTRRRDAKLGYATVFRTLKAMVDCGIARETDFSDGRTRFEKHFRKPDHHHIVCQSCGKAIEFFSPELEALEERIVASYHVKPIRQKIQIYGICEDCQASESKHKKEPENFDANLVFARDALRIAMETEQRGITFYTTAAENSTHPSTRRSFLEMLEEEKGHLQHLQEEWNRLLQENPRISDAPVFLHFDFEALKQIFPSRETVLRRMKDNLSEIEALKLAMNMELEAYNFFSEYAEKFKDTKGRDIFLKFAEEEQDHYNLIKSELERLLESQEG
jgi:Fur family ferric uptake transcriptional regulator